jgi:hypothetical protein
MIADKLAVIGKSCLIPIDRPTVKLHSNCRKPPPAGKPDSSAEMRKLIGGVVARCRR